MKNSLLIVFFLASPFFTHAKALVDTLTSIETSISGRLGVSVLNTENAELWHYNGNQRFPLMSTFKTLACAKMLHDAATNTLDLESKTVVKEEQLVFWSPITKKLINKTISVNDACEATMLTSDNTAANIVLEHINGPKEMTSFLRILGDKVTRLDRIEPDLNEAKTGDLRDTTTPNAMVETLNTLLFGEVLTKSASTQLKNWMQQNTISDALLRSTLPQGWKIADRTGAGQNGSRGITAIIWNGSRPPLIIAIYITETELPLKQRNRVIAEIGSAIFQAFDVD